MTIDEIIDDLILREGPSTNDPVDSGGRTTFGISEKANKDLWRDGVVEADEARARYKSRYFVAPGFDKIKSEPLKIQLFDFGVNSGPPLAIKYLQRVLMVKEDGILGPETLAALDKALPYGVNNALVAERVKMLARVVQKSPSQLKFLSGWVSRALLFLA